MKILFLTIAYPLDRDSSNIYSDLMKEFAENGNNVYVLSALEKRFKKETYIESINGIKTNLEVPYQRIAKSTKVYFYACIGTQST